jgi:hypothetical protein
MPEEIVMRHRFRNSDIFFKRWDMLQVITVILGWCDQHGCVRGFYRRTHDKEVEETYESVFSVGNTTDQEDAYRSFRDVTPRWCSWEQEVLIPLKRRIKMIENGIQFNKKSDLNFKSLFYIYNELIILKQLFEPVTTRSLSKDFT